MRNVINRSCRENQNTHFVSNNFFFRKSFRLWSDVETAGGAGGATNDVTIWRKRLTCWINKATCMRPRTHRCLMFILFYGNAPQYYVIRALDVFFLIPEEISGFHDILFAKTSFKRYWFWSKRPQNFLLLEFLFELSCYDVRKHIPWTAHATTVAVRILRFWI
jgi:hypothetical protein